MLEEDTPVLEKENLMPVETQHVEIKENLQEALVEIEKNLQNWCNRCNDYKTSEKHQKHKLQRNKSRRKTRSKRKISKKCQDCEEDLSPNSKSYCEKHFYGRKEIKQNNINNGKCCCGRERMLNKNRCEKCFYANLASKHLGSKKLGVPLQKKFIEKCTYCGKNLPIQKAIIGHYDCLLRNYSIIKKAKLLQDWKNLNQSLKDPNISNKDKDKLINRFRRKIGQSKLITLDNVAWICVSCNNFQGQNNWQEFQMYCCSLYDENITKSIEEIESDEYILRVFDICQYQGWREKK